MRPFTVALLCLALGAPACRTTYDHQGPVGTRNTWDADETLRPDDLRLVQHGLQPWSAFEHKAYAVGPYGSTLLVNTAASQLRATNDPVKAVARDWGFTDASHMHRNFVKHYGCTPNEYRVRRDV